MSESESLSLSPTSNPRKFRAADGTILEPPAGWDHLPPGDAGLTRRVKAAGPSWTVSEKKGRKVFSRGVWAPAVNIEAARQGIEAKRADPAYARSMERAAERREEKQTEYEGDFRQAVLDFLHFGPAYQGLAERMAAAVTELSAPVGSGTVARTQRLTIEEKAEAAVIAWLRHQTTAYDSMRIERVKGRRREVRQELASSSRRMLDAHRKPDPHGAVACALCGALPAPQPAR